MVTGSTLYFMGLYMYIIYNYCGERCHMKYQLRPFLCCSINTEEKIKGRERKGREKRREERREERKGRGTELYIQCPTENSRGQKESKFHRWMFGLLLPTLSPNESEQQTHTVLLTLNREVKNWFSPTPIRQSFFAHF